MRIFWWHSVCLLLRYEGNDGRGSDDGMMSGWRLYILGWKVREVCFIFVCQFVSLSVHRFIFIRQFVSLSVRQFYFHSSVRRFVSSSVHFRSSVCQFVSSSGWPTVGLSACRFVLLVTGGAMLSALQNIFFLAAELCVLLIVPAYAKKIARALWFLFIVWIIYLNGLFLAPILPACLFFDDPFWWADFQPRFTDELTNWRTDN